MITLAPHGEEPREDLDTDPCGRCQRRGDGYVHGVIFMSTDIGDVPGVGVRRKGTQSVSYPQTLHVQALEGKY